jgi:hypothetical protein
VVFWQPSLTDAFWKSHHHRSGSQLRHLAVELRRPLVLGLSLLSLLVLVVVLLVRVFRPHSRWRVAVVVAVAAHSLHRFHELLREAVVAARCLVRVLVLAQPRVLAVLVVQFVVEVVF